MKTKLLIYLFSFLLVSCSTTNKILVIDDTFKEEKSIKLLQSLEGYSDEHKSLFLDCDYYFPIKTVYSKSMNEEGKVVMEFKLTTTTRPEELDSVIYMMLDDEKIRLVSSDYRVRNYIHNSTTTSTETSTTHENDDDNNENNKKTTKSSLTTTNTDQTLQAMKHHFEIPREIWAKIIFSEKIMLRAYMESEGIDIRFSHSQRTKFGDFFKEVLKNQSSRSSS